MKLLLENWRRYLTEQERPGPGRTQSRYEKETSPPPIRMDGFGKATYYATGEQGRILQEEDTKASSKVVIIDDDKVLVLKRAKDSKFKPNHWDLPGGHLKKLETKRPDGQSEGTERETMEETGLLLPYLEPIGSHNFTWKDKTHNINFFQTKLERKKPKVNLNMQDFQENSEYVWVSIDEMFKYAKNGTQILRSAVEMVNNQGLISEESRFQRSQKRKHKKMKKRLIGLGKNKSFGGGKGHKRPKMSRSKSAPAGFGALEEEDGKKKRKIKVKIVDNIDEKRKKRRKKRRKRRKNRAKYAYYGGYLPHRSDDYGSNGGDGGGGE